MNAKMTENNDKLRIESLSKTYGNVVALKPTSLNVSPGEFITLLGPSGSGKTTLLLMLAGLVAPDSGRIWIDGSDSTTTPVFKRGIGMVFQNYALFPHLTVFENIAFPLRMRRMSEAEIRLGVERVLSVVHLSHAADRLPRQLSGGQQQRVALARCAVYEPSVILMDEPLGALDKKLRDSMQIEIKRLHTELGTTILYVTHDQEEAMAMSDRICLMRESAIEQIGTPDDLYFRPRSVFAADFLGGANILPGRVRAANAGRLVVEIAGGVAVGAADIGNVQPGEMVDVMVRPEHFTLGAGDGDGNRIEVIVDQPMVVGPVTRYYCRLPSGEPIVALALTTGPRRLAPGARITLTWSSERTTVITRRREVLS